MGPYDVVTFNTGTLKCEFVMVNLKPDTLYRYSIITGCALKCSLPRRSRPHARFTAATFHNGITTHHYLHSCHFH